MPDTVQTSNAAREVPTRRLSFEESLQTLPKHFAADGDLILSHLIASLSAVFPDGEPFFVRSVRRFRDQVTDPDLRRQVNGYIGQETMHGREHRALNDRLAQLGYPVRRVEAITKGFFAAREKVTSPRSNLAATAALEHFTATLAELVLSNEEVQRLIGHQQVKQLFLWHCMEECEHKAVTYDVYRAVGGTDRMRVWTMKVTRYSLTASLTALVIISLLGDRDSYRRGALRQSWGAFLRSPIAPWRFWDQLKDYDRPDFHPDDSDTNGLVERWRSELFGPEGTLNDRLSGAA
jgi:predicted metal-dependent hydrolase